MRQAHSRGVVRTQRATCVSAFQEVCTDGARLWTRDGHSSKDSRGLPGAREVRWLLPTPETLIVRGGIAGPTGKSVLRAHRKVHRSFCGTPF